MENFKARIAEICEKNQFDDPLELLVGLTNGKDLRQKSPVLEWLERYDEETGVDEPPDSYDWAQLVSLIRNECRYSPVSQSASLTAQKTLMEYMHPKRKQVDVTTNSIDGAVQPLTPKEVRTFKRRFNKLC